MSVRLTGRCLTGNGVLVVFLRTHVILTSTVSKSCNFSWYLNRYWWPKNVVQEFYLQKCLIQTRLGIILDELRAFIFTISAVLTKNTSFLRFSSRFSGSVIWVQSSSGIFLWKYLITLFVYCGGISIDFKKQQFDVNDLGDCGQLRHTYVICSGIRPAVTTFFWWRIIK